MTHGVAMGIGTYVVGRGVNAIERVAKILMPTLIVLVLVLTARAVTLPGASGGLDYLFSVDWSRLGEARLWVEALTQNAWDTGAGWGLVLCYAAYLRDHEDTALNAFVLPVANNAISLLAGVMVLCTVFSVVPQMVARLASDPEALAAFPALSEAVKGGAPLSAELIQTSIFASSNEGLTFIWMPQLFATLPFGRVLMVLFFLSLSFAAITSLIAMVELGTRVLVDAGVEHLRAVRLVGSGRLRDGTALRHIASSPRQSRLGVGCRAAARGPVLRDRGNQPRRAASQRRRPESPGLGHPDRQVVGHRDRFRRAG